MGPRWSTAARSPIGSRRAICCSANRRGAVSRGAFPVFDAEGNKIAFWLGFTHRFFQRRGISRLSAPRDAMNGFDDLNYAHIKSALRALDDRRILMESTAAARAAVAAGRRRQDSRNPARDTRSNDFRARPGVDRRSSSSASRPRSSRRRPATTCRAGTRTSRRRRSSSTRRCCSRCWRSISTCR